MTTSTLSRCTDDGIEGTSYSAPIVAGIIALALQAKYESKLLQLNIFVYQVTDFVAFYFC